jgi:hypothetical protein
MKKILMIVAAILILALVAGGSFWGGMKYQTAQAAQIQANFFNARGGQFPGDGQSPGAGQRQNGGQFPSGGPGFAGGRGTVGEVKSIDGNVLTLSTAQNVTTVNLSDSTQIQKTASGTTADLQPGTRVLVTGETDSKGTITANRITILDGNFQMMMNPPATGTAP